jgi:AraC family transcriptional regulator
MHIEWTPNNVESPYLFRQANEWSGVKIHRARVVPGRMLPHTADCHEINVSVSGCLITERISSTGKRIRTRGGTGTLCLTPNGQTVGAYWEKPLDNLGILLSPDFVKTTATANLFPQRFEFREVYDDRDPLVEQIGIALLNDAAADSPGGRLYVDSMLQTLTLHLLKKYSTAGTIGENASGGLSGFKLRRVKEYIDANLEDDLSLAELAEVADLSQFHFARAFRKSTGKTPQQFLMEQRIERAKILLTDENLPLVEISLRTGFKNQSHFTTLFRKLTKLTPKIWRETKLA